MSRTRARLPKPVSPSTPGDSNLLSGLDPCPGADRASMSTSEEALEAARFLVWDLVDEWGAQSFPASDPPANW
jgi:hypothetical protein